jgi:hypothetical protein
MVMTKKARTSKASGTTARTGSGTVEFNYANVSYQVDPARRKVYHRWVEVETARTCMIMSAFQQAQNPVKRAV